MIPFHSVPPLSGSPIGLDSYSPQSIKGKALEEEIQALCRKGAVEAAPPFPMFYSRMFVVTKASGGVEIYDRSLHSEPVGGENAVSDGDCPLGSPLGAKE